MTPKERVLTALNHQEPDRVPLDLGGWVTTINSVAYHNLMAHLGIKRQKQPYDTMRQIIAPDEDVLERLGVDTRTIYPGRPHSWVFAPTKKENGFYINDHWGCGHLKTPSSPFYNLVNSPLAKATVSDLETYPWPDPRDPGYIEGLGQRAKALYDEGEYAIVGDFAWETWYERAWKLRGMAQFYTDMILNKEFLHALLDITLSRHLDFLDHILFVCGDYVDVIHQAGDLAGQERPLMSLEHYREFVKPRQAKIIEKIKSLSNAKIFYHCCGAVSSLLDDFIDVGIDILNPVQVGASGMDAASLKKRYGDRICFWGGVDSQRVLPYGTPQDVENEVRHLIREMSAGGGLVICAVHNIQAEVLPQNVLALYDSARKWGRYPISADV